jgi:protein-L-isoaspartate(D-aspartate) O-methyltransferase
MKPGRPCWLLGLAALLLYPWLAALGEDLAQRRMDLINEIESDVWQTRRELGRDRLSPAVLDALRTVPRHEFVPEGYLYQAYGNHPVPIGYGQTISQPYIVAIMTELIEPQPHFQVFELGTGSGYQAAILSRLVQRVYTLEVIEALGTDAAERLRRLGYDNVEVKIGDGYHGWPDKAPFDAILVTAAGDHVPPPLIEQLKPGGRLIIPVGGRGLFSQQLVLITKEASGEISSKTILPVAFVPLTGKH